MKRFIAILITAIFLLPLFVFSASAATPKTAYDALKQGMYDCDEIIDINVYNIKLDNIKQLMESVLKNEPMLFHLGDSYGYAPSGTKVTAIAPTYVITGSELTKARAFVETEIAHILSTIPNGLDDYETVAYLHDYICVNFAYDTTYTIHDMYGFLKEDTGVCMSYALLFDELLYRLGIETRAIISPAEELNHMWSEVELDGVWYQVDTTWDDPLQSPGIDRYGKVSHANFLKSDTAMSETHNKRYNIDYPCTNTKYDEMQWQYIDTPFGFVNGEIYVLDYNVISKVDLHTDETETIFTAGERYWYATDDSYIGCCIGFGSYNNLLYYNTEDSIMSYNPVTDTAKTVYTPDKEGMIVGMYMDGNVVNYLLSSSGKAEDGVNYTYTIDESAEPDVSTPETSTPETSEPETSTPETSEPETSTPETSEPETSTPETSDPETSTPESSEPETSEPETSEPETSEPETSEPETSEPETSDSETSTPETSEPETSDPETSTPETSEPETSDSETSTPETSEPETSDSETSTPETSEPETSTPETSEPEESNPIDDSIADIDEDGDIDAADYILVKRAVLKTYNLDDKQKLVADIDADGDIDATDYVLVKRIVLGTYIIKQNDE